MSNPLFDMLGANMPPAFQNMSNMITQFNQFKSSFQGDPKQQVMSLLSCGKMTQEQYKQLEQMAKQFQKMLR